MSYYLKVYDNFNYMEEGEVFFEKGFRTPEEALTRARGMVVSCLEENWKPGMNEDTLKALYTMYGDDPVIISEDGEKVQFPAWDYATQIVGPVVLRLELEKAETQKIYQLIIRYVAEKHIDQKIPGTELPYLVHLSNVAMEILMAAQHSKEFNLNFALKVALLHDCLEDTSVTEEDLEFIFGDKVLSGVLALTKNSKLTKEERMKDSLQRIKRQPKEVWAVKMADRITNLQPPPKEWDEDKINKYAEEASEIHEFLKEGNEYLATRLKNTIAGYRGYHNNKIMKRFGR